MKFRDKVRGREV